MNILCEHWPDEELLPSERWLREAANAGTGIIWCGSGFSFAAAETAATMLRERGVPSYASRPEALPKSPPLPLVCFSRSGRLPASRVDALVSQKGAEDSMDGRFRILDVRSSDSFTGRWLPTRYTGDAVLSVGRAIGVGSIRTCQKLPYFTRQSKYIVLLLDKHADIVRAVLAAGAEKIGPIPICAFTVHEFGHGFHSQIWRSPDNFQIYLCSQGVSRSNSWNKVVHWLSKIGIAPQFVEIGGAERPDGAALVTSLFAIKLVDEFAKILTDGTDTSPLPAELDDLRDA